MSLTVSIHVFNVESYTIGEDILFEDSAEFKSAGFESWRKELYGHPLLQELGCKLFPQLKEDNVCVEKDDIYQLKNDCDIVLNNLEVIHKHTLINKESIKNRIQNILQAIKVASLKPHAVILIQ